MDEWGTKIDDLEARVTVPHKEGEIGHIEKMDALRTRRQEARLRYDALKASGDDWETMSKDVDKSIEELKLAFERAQSAIK